VYDLVYNPPSTRLMQECIARGGASKNGQDMLELQAEAAWSIWNSPA
jgi:shikimate dehydrogenase